MLNIRTYKVFRISCYGHHEGKDSALVLSQRSALAEQSKRSHWTSSCSVRSPALLCRARQSREQNNETRISYVYSRRASFICSSCSTVTDTATERQEPTNGMSTAAERAAPVLSVLSVLSVLFTRAGRAGRSERTQGLSTRVSFVYNHDGFCS